MGPELFDYAFKEYSERWAFKHPTPADFFRTMEDASAVDLDWFWKGWFYTTDHVDVSLDKVRWFKMNIPETKIENQTVKGKNKNIQSGDLIVTNDLQWSSEPLPFDFKNTEDKYYYEFRNRVDDEAVKRAHADRNFYEVTLSNKGGLVTPVIIEWIYEDGTREREQIPAEVWRKNEEQVVKVFAKDKKVTNIIIDPDEKTADVNTEDNVFPRVQQQSDFDAFKSLKN